MARWTAVGVTAVRRGGRVKVRVEFRRNNTRLTTEDLEGASLVDCQEQVSRRLETLRDEQQTQSLTEAVAGRILGQLDDPGEPE
jgi:hypothetical protein